MTLPMNKILISLASRPFPWTQFKGWRQFTGGSKSVLPQGTAPALSTEHAGPQGQNKPVCTRASHPAGFSLCSSPSALPRALIRHGGCSGATTPCTEMLCQLSGGCYHCLSHSPGLERQRKPRSAAHLLPALIDILLIAPSHTGKALCTTLGQLLQCQEFLTGWPARVVLPGKLQFQQRI